MWIVNNVIIPISRFFTFKIGKDYFITKLTFEVHKKMSSFLKGKYHIIFKLISILDRFRFNKLSKAEKPINTTRIIIAVRIWYRCSSANSPNVNRYGSSDTTFALLQGIWITWVFRKLLLSLLSVIRTNRETIIWSKTMNIAYWEV